jgi:2-hydroxycyclohexanecarboxyl-CoA dehydrogenase
MPPCGGTPVCAERRMKRTNDIESDMTNRLTGKVAMITGGGRGIGLTTAELFTWEQAKVILVDRDESLLQEAAKQILGAVPGAEIAIAVADVAQESDAAAAVAKAITTFGALDILVNNAAIRDVSPVKDSKRENWERIVSVNVIGAVNFYKAAAESLRQSGKASVINVSSIGALFGRKDWGIYDATKAALLALTRTLAHEEAEFGVRVNAVCAAGTVTPFTAGRAVERGQTADDLRKEVRSDNLLGRWARPLEMAYPILWLASDEASFITGSTLMVDGGRK